VRFDDRVTGKLSDFAPHAKIIHLDIDAAEIGKNRKADWAIIADAREGLERFTAEVELYLSEGRTGRLKALEEWWKVLDGWRADQPLSFKPQPGKILPQQVLQELQRQTAGDLVAVTDIGQHQMWAAQYIVVDQPRTFISSGGLGTMGYGMPAALGAQIALPGRRVVAIVGDGGFQMTYQELALLIDQSIPLKILVMNNGYLGMVRQWQELFYEKRYLGVDLAESPDFVVLAQAFGIKSSRVSDPAALEGAIREMLAHPGPYLLDARVDHAEHVYPMVPAGAASKDMILQPK
jgi:acetolactate synthase-1/2/3 large subunit